jgi:hypothetical protein
VDLSKSSGFSGQFCQNILCRIYFSGKPEFHYKPEMEGEVNFFHYNSQAPIATGVAPAAGRSPGGAPGASEYTPPIPNRKKIKN